MILIYKKIILKKIKERNKKINVSINNPGKRLTKRSSNLLKEMILKSSNYFLRSDEGRSN
jgi:hypothetical protein